MHKYFKITFKKESKDCILKYGENSKELKNIKINSEYYLNAKNIEKKTISAINNKNNKIDIKTEELKFFGINKTFAQKEYDSATEEINNLERENQEKIVVILTINNNKNIDTNRIDKNENFKTLEKIMGESGLKRVLIESINIIGKKDYKIDDIKIIIKQLKEHFKNLTNLEFQTPKFENGLGPASNTNIYCDKFKNEFKNKIIGKLESLIKSYEKFNSLKKKHKKKY